MTRRQILEVAKREIVTRGRTRGFRAITAIMILIAIAAPIVLAVLPDPSDELQTITIGVGDGAPENFEATLKAFAEGQLIVETTNLSLTPTEAVDQMLSDGDIDVAFEPPNTLAWENGENLTIASLITAALQQDAMSNRAADLGLDSADLTTLFTPVDLTNRTIGDDDASEGLRSAAAFVGLFTAFVLPQIYGQLTLLSVVEEKSTRIVEVLLSHLRPQTLLLGKIIGLCALALVQLTLIVAAMVGSLLVVDQIDVPSSVWQFVPMFAISVFGGLAMYTTVFALLGSLISRQEDAAQVMMPVFVPLMVGYLVGQSGVWGTADSLILRILTWFPLTSPMILPVRVARDAIGPFELAISLGLLALGVFLLIKLAGKVYEFTLLRTGSRVGWRELIRLSAGRAE